MAETGSISLVLACFLVLFWFGSVGARIQLPPNTTVPALIGFGDSIIDPGNNNDIKTIVKCNFPPYGLDFMGGRATGRFSNGRIPTDLIVEELGLKSYLPAYLDPSLKQEELLTGVSFASGASGYDPQTSVLASVISMPDQLKYFQEYKGKLNKMVGAARTDFIVKNAVYLVVAGSDDIANTYFILPFRRKTYDFESYTNLMLNKASDFVQQLYGQGARRMAIFGAPPIGCVPSQRTLGGGLERVCANDYNKVAQMFNSKLSASLSSLQSKHPDARIVYIDIYTPLYDMIVNPHKYGVEVVMEGCCGTGLLEVSVLCNKFDPVCADPSKYLFWDSYHPTEKGYQMLTKIILEKYIKELV